MIKMLLTLILMLVTCGPEKKPTNATPDQLSQLAAKTEWYEFWFKQQQDEFGFIETSACDSLIFTGLSNPNAVLTAAEVEPGRWLRRPIAYPECWSSKSSRSELSRDGVLGVIYWSIENNDADTLLRLWRYGETHNWVMAEGGWEHSIMTPAYISLLAQALYYTSNGSYDYTVRHVRYPMQSMGDGFEGHLQLVLMLIQKKVYGSTLATDKTVARQLADARPENPLAQYMAGNISTAVDLLLNKFPNNRLPDTNDWCAAWINEQAADGNGLKPCPGENKTHSGGDFLFTARLILGR